MGLSKEPRGLRGLTVKARKSVTVSIAIFGGLALVAGAVFLFVPSKPSDVPSATNRTWSEIGLELQAECQKYEFFITNTPAGRGENIEGWLAAVKRISGGQRSEAFRLQNPVVEEFAQLDISSGLRDLGGASLDSMIADGGPWNMSRLSESYPDTYKVLSYNTANKALEVCGLKSMSETLALLAGQSRLIVDRAAKYRQAEASDTSDAVTGGPETLAQENARRAAQDYLAFTSFSREGLVKQLEFEGFSRSDATYGVDATSTDWNQQAALMAQDYLDLQGFSKEALRDQLIFEGFTPSQASYGLTAVGY